MAPTADTAPPRLRHGAAAGESKAPAEREQKAGCPQTRSPTAARRNEGSPGPKAPRLYTALQTRNRLQLRGRRGGEANKPEPPPAEAVPRWGTVPSRGERRTTHPPVAVTYRPQRAAGQRRAAHGSAARYVPMAGFPASRGSRPSPWPAPAGSSSERNYPPFSNFLAAVAAAGKEGRRTGRRPAAAPRPPQTGRRSPSTPRRAS